jgi:hypothetical protein
MVSTYQGPANFSLPYGGLIRALLPAGVVPEGSPLISGLEAIGNKTFRAMKISEVAAQPTFEHRVLEQLGRLEEVVERQGEHIQSLETEIRTFRRQRG